MATTKAKKPKVNKRFDAKKVEITNPDKVFWEKENITKGDVIDCCNEMAEYML